MRATRRSALPSSVRVVVGVSSSGSSSCGTPGNTSTIRLPTVPLQVGKIPHQPVDERQVLGVKRRVYFIWKLLAFPDVELWSDACDGRAQSFA